MSELMDEFAAEQVVGPLDLSRFDWLFASVCYRIVEQGGGRPGELADFLMFGENRTGMTEKEIQSNLSAMLGSKLKRRKQ